MVESWKERAISKATPGPLNHATEGESMELGCSKPSPPHPLQKHDAFSLPDRQKGSSCYAYLFYVFVCVHLHMWVHECRQRAGANLRCHPQEVSTLFLRLGLSLEPGTHPLG